MAAHPASRFVATAAAVGIHIAALHLPLTQYVLRVEAIGLAAWVRIIVVASTVLFATEAHKALVRRRARQPRRQC